MKRRAVSTHGDGYNPWETGDGGNAEFEGDGLGDPTEDYGEWKQFDWEELEWEDTF